MPTDSFRVLSKRYWTAVSNLSAEDVLILKTIIAPNQRDEFAVSSARSPWQSFDAAKFAGYDDKLGFPKVPIGPIGPKTVERLRGLAAAQNPPQTTTSTKSLISEPQRSTENFEDRLLFFAVTPDRLDWVSEVYKIKRDRIILLQIPSDYRDRHYLRLYIQTTYYEFVGGFEAPNIFLFDPTAYRDQLNKLAAEYKKLKLG